MWKNGILLAVLSCTATDPSFANHPLAPHLLPGGNLSHQLSNKLHVILLLDRDGGSVVFPVGCAGEAIPQHVSLPCWQVGNAVPHPPIEVEALVCEELKGSCLRGGAGGGGLQLFAEIFCLSQLVFLCTSNYTSQSLARSVVENIMNHELS